MAEVLQYLLVQVSNQLQRCRFDPRIACLENTDTAIVGDGVGGTPRPELLTGAKKFQLGCLIRYWLSKFHSDINKIHPFIAILNSTNFFLLGARETSPDDTIVGIIPEVTVRTI